MFDHISLWTILSSLLTNEPNQPSKISTLDATKRERERIFEKEKRRKSLLCRLFCRLTYLLD